MTVIQPSDRGRQTTSRSAFYQIGRGTGGDKLIEWTRKYGFGQKTGIELKGEESEGLVADDECS